MNKWQKEGCFTTSVPVDPTFVDDLLQQVAVETAPTLFLSLSSHTIQPLAYETAIGNEQKNGNFYTV